MEKNITAQRLWDLRYKAGLTDIIARNGYTKPGELFDWVKKEFGYRTLFAWHFRNIKQLHEEYRGKRGVVTRFRIP